MAFFRRFSLALLALIAVGCESVPPPKSEMRLPDVREDAALIIILRFGTGHEFALSSVPISVDGKDIFSVKDLGYSWFFLKPGSHQFKAEWSIWNKPMFEDGHFAPSILKVDAEPGKSYFINYEIDQDTAPDTILEKTGLLGKAMSKSHVTSAGLVLMKHETARSRLEVCVFQPNKFQ